MIAFVALEIDFLAILGYTLAVGSILLAALIVYYLVNACSVDLANNERLR